MNAFREVVARLDRRDRRLRGAVWGASILAAATLVAFAAALASTFLRLEWPGWLALLLGVMALGVAAAAYALGTRARRSLSQLLFEVDVRLGLEARLSSLLAMEERGRPTAFSERVFRDLTRMAPNWKRGLPVPRTAFFVGATAGLALAATLALALISPGAGSRDTAVSSPDSSIAAAPVSEGPGEAAERRDQELPTDASPAGGDRSTPAAGRSQRTLRDILSDLRPALASTPASAASESTRTQETEAARAELQSELARLQDELRSSEESVSEEDMQRLRDAAAPFPDVAGAIEDASESSDLDALRRTISQLLDSSAAKAPTTSLTRSEAVPSGEPSSSPSQDAAEGPNGGPSPDAPAATPSGATTGTEGDPSSATLTQEEAPIFDESGVGDVAPVAPPLAVGGTGDVTAYLTSGVPAEEDSNATAQETAWVLSPGRIQSVLSARDLPSGAAEIIRDYFERITEETP